MFLPIVGAVVGCLTAGIMLYAKHRAKRREEYEPPTEDVVSLEREYRIYLGEQKCGKTYELHEEVRYFAERGCTVFVCDIQREFGNEGKVFPSFEKYERYTKRAGLPAVCVFQFGSDAEAYRDVFAEAIREATADEDTTVCVVVDEFYNHAPVGARWTGGDDLREILLAGRHVTNYDGDIACVHVVGAMQYPHTSHLLVWQQAESIVVGKARGDRFYSWLAKNHGSDVVDQARRLEAREWLCVDGDPRPGSGAMLPATSPAGLPEKD